MWTVTHAITTAEPGLHTRRLVVAVTEVAPFVFEDDVYLHVASLPDMALIAEGGSSSSSTSNLFREHNVDLLFRNESMANDAWDDINGDLTLLYDIYSKLSDKYDEVLFTNYPHNSSSSSSSSSSLGKTSSSSSTSSVNSSSSSSSRGIVTSSSSLGIITSSSSSSSSTSSVNSSSSSSHSSSSVNSSSSEIVP